MRNCTVYYKPIKHEGDDNNTDATYRYVLNPETVGTFSNITTPRTQAVLAGGFLPFSCTGEVSAQDLRVDIAKFAL